AGNFTVASGFLEWVEEQPAAQLWLEPGRLGGHDLPRVADVEQLLHRGGPEREGGLCLAAVDPGRQFAGATDAAAELDARISPQVGDAEHRTEHALLEERDVQRRAGIGGDGLRPGHQAPPAPVAVEPEGVTGRWL